MRAASVHLFVFDGMADWETVFAMAGINNPQLKAAPGPYKMITAGLALAPVTTIGGIRIQPDVMLEDLSPFKSGMLILPGGENWEYGANSAAIAMARRFIAHCVPVAAICEATWALARAGLLDNRYHTSNAPEYLAASGYRGGRFYRDKPAIADQGVITASGTAPVDFAREIFEALNLYRADMLDAWYGLFRHGDTSMFYESARSA
ncbi:MAG TPA: DJ-1/PfpI family protein [Terracidiphilus sp.]|jgi:transcriptional regulator GlxA family with amidase domain|nr:DJ-1/PfpI family protein [Terracidiphilus sp.]